MAIKTQPRLKPFISIKELIYSLIPVKKPIEKFQKKFANKFNNEFGIMFSHGRSGLYSLFKAWELENVEIICPAYTCVVVPHSIVLSNNIPVFIDCEEESWNMSYSEIEKSINEKTRVIIVTHLFGFPMNLRKIDSIVKKAEKKYGNKIYVVQDCAHSFGCMSDNNLVSEFGDASIFGLNISKLTTSIFGGMVTTNNKLLAEKLFDYRKNNYRKNNFKNIKRYTYMCVIFIAFNPVIYSIVNWIERKGYIDGFVKYYNESQISFPKDWDELPCSIEAKVGLIQLKKYDFIVEKRISNANKWMGLLKNEDIKFLKTIKGTTFSHCVGLVEDREKWKEKWRKKGIQLGEIIEYSIPEMSAYKKYKKKDFPIANYYRKRTVNFPIHPKINIPNNA